MTAEASCFFIAAVVLSALFLWHWQRSKHMEQTLREQIASLQQQNQVLIQDAWVHNRNEWLKYVSQNQYRNEIEVEVKFIYPLLRYLGYNDNELQVRVPVQVQVGHQLVGAEADWVILDSRQNKPIIVIEAKEPNRRLDDAVRDQARSYAFGLKAAVYATTNGNRLRVYQRGVVDDQCVVDCDTKELANSWPAIERVMGKYKA